MSSTILQNISLDARTLDKECPHIVRAIMILMWTLEGRNRPLAHPMTSLSRYLLIELARSPDRSENDIVGDVEFARITLGLGGLVEETIPTTVEVCTEPAIGLDDIGTEDPQSYVTPVHTLAVGTPGCRVTVPLGRQPELEINIPV